MSWSLHIWCLLAISMGLSALCDLAVAGPELGGSLAVLTGGAP